LNRDFIFGHWYADAYEQFENQANDVEYLLGHLREYTDGSPQNILEVACGGGRIAVPLAEAGHNVTGFDADGHMLLRCLNRMRELSNLRCYQADALTADWGCGYDVVVLGGNLLINIETSGDYKDAQQTFIARAAGALRRGGHLWLDFDLLFDPSKAFNHSGERRWWKHTDDLGTRGELCNYGGVYNPETQICVGSNHTELILSNGDKLIRPRVWHKHIPTRHQVYEWLNSAGFVVEHAFKNFTGEPLGDPIAEDNFRATIWAEKR
jgi:SAM-dependent methyltransferase